MSRRGRLRVLAPAKLNLYLHVTGRRADGYHLLDSLVAFAGVGDVVEAAAAEELSLAVDGPWAPALSATPVEDNLALRAARLLREAAGLRAGAALRLHKTLPVAAGIGGGSADAAATLRVLAALWGLEADERRLFGIAAALGADVPACLAARPVQMSGIGERLAPAPPLPAAWVVLVNPGVPLSTPAVFGRRRREGFSRPAPLTGAPPDAGALAGALAQRRNDLTEAAIALAPQVGGALRELDRSRGCLLSRMSGSGATCFGLYAGEDTARAALAALQERHPEWWLARAPLLTTAPAVEPA